MLCPVRFLCGEARYLSYWVCRHQGSCRLVFPGRHLLCWLFTWKVTERVVSRMRKRRARKRTLLTFSPRHSWPITAWSRCKCQTVSSRKLQEWSDTAASYIGKLQGTRVFRSHSTFQQALLKEHTGSSRRFQMYLYCSINSFSGILL